MGEVSEHGYRQIAAGIGVPFPGEHDATLRFFHAWQHAEGGHAAHNPFNTTRPMPGDTYYNSFGPHGEYHVRNYASEEDGVEATVLTIREGLHSHGYDAIVFALRDGDANAAARAVDASPWGTASFTVPGFSGGGSSESKEFDVAQLPTLHVGSAKKHPRSVKALIALLRAHPAGAELAENATAYGEKVKAAVHDYQSHHGLDADGIVGPLTWAHLLGAGD